MVDISMLQVDFHDASFLFVSVANGQFVMLQKMILHVASIFCSFLSALVSVQSLHADVLQEWDLRATANVLAVEWRRKRGDHAVSACYGMGAGTPLILWR